MSGLSLISIALSSSTCRSSKVLDSIPQVYIGLLINTIQDVAMNPNELNHKYNSRGYCATLLFPYRLVRFSNGVQCNIQHNMRFYVVHWCKLSILYIFRGTKTADEYNNIVSWAAQCQHTCNFLWFSCGEWQFFCEVIKHMWCLRNTSFYRTMLPCL